MFRYGLAGSRITARPRDTSRAHVVVERSPFRHRTVFDTEAVRLRLYRHLCNISHSPRGTVPAERGGAGWRAGGKGPPGD